MIGAVRDLRDFCRGILESGDLAAKLAAPGGLASQPAERGAPRRPQDGLRPVRGVGLAMRSGAESLPRLHELALPAARARCLARFAHHELMAVELFAWAILRWPEAPPALQQGLLAILAEEQTHCHLYLERLAEHDSELGAHEPHSDYFWKQATAIESSPEGLRAFLAAMGLTLEQSNLDFSLLYRDAFRTVGDEQSARVCERVHADEIRHVRFAAEWLKRLSAPGRSLTEAYREAVPFPLSAARAKGRRFDVAARRRAGLDAEFIEHVRGARSSQERDGGPRDR